MSGRQIVFIHGMFVTHRCWEEWADRFTGEGYDCVAPAWPGREPSVRQLRERHPDPAVGALTLGDVLAAYEAIVRAEPEPPILIGHSMGGLIVQLLLARGLGACGVAIDSAPPQGVFVPSLSFLRSNWPAINPLVSARKPVMLSFEQFRYAFVNTLDEPEQYAAYDRHCVPESRQVGRAPLTDVAAIDFARARPPLLLIAGGADHIIPASLNRANFRRYGAAAPTDFHEMPGRCHYLIGRPGWEDVADVVSAWLKARAG